MSAIWIWTFVLLWLIVLILRAVMSVSVNLVLVEMATHALVSNYNPQHVCHLCHLNVQTSMNAWMELTAAIIMQHV